MDELIRCTLTKSYIPINATIELYSKELVSLCESMMVVKVSKRATIKNIISSPYIVVDYYRRYFDFN